MQYDAECKRAARRYAVLAKNTCSNVLDEEDLYAEACIAVHEALQQYTDQGVPQSVWIKTRIKQRLFDCIRRFNIHSRSEVKALKENPSALRRRFTVLDDTLLAGKNVAADLQVEQYQQLTQLKEAIAALTTNQRIALTGCFLEERTLLDVAQQLGISESRVCQLQKRAIRNLQRWFTQSVSEPLEVEEVDGV